MATIDTQLDLISQDDDLRPEGVGSKLSNIALDKGKLLIEALINSLFYLKQGFGNEDLTGVEKSLKNVKSVLAIPSFIKGSIDLAGNLRAGKLALTKAIADASFVLCDGIETLKFSCSDLSGKTTLSKATIGLLEKVKTVASVIGISRSIVDGVSDIKKLEKIKLDHVDGKHVSDKSRALELKKQWHFAELSAKKCDMLKNVTGLVLTLLGYCYGTALPWTMALITTASIAGKVMNSFYKEDAVFWRNRYAEVLK